MQASTLKNRLASLDLPAYRYFDTLGSTNDEALAWLEQGAPDFALVVAADQTRGKGRLDRRWSSRPGASLTFTVILKPTPEEQPLLPLFSALAGLAVLDALESYLNLHAEIKWPNDVLLERRKCCGILAEAYWQGDSLKGIVLGIGVNLTRQSVPPADEIRFAAACLEEFSASKINAFDFLAAILTHLRRWRQRLNTQAFFDHWVSHLAFIGEKVSLKQGENGSIIGIEKGIDPNGNLLVQLEDGQLSSVVAGDLHLRPMDEPAGGSHA